MELAYRVLNVFAVPNDPFSGNTMCLFEDGSGLSEQQMGSLAQQMNVETSFVISRGEAPDVRFFSPEGMSGFAGSASIGTAYALAGATHEDRVATTAITLNECEYGEVPITHEGGVWALHARPAKVKRVRTDPVIVAAMIGLSPDALAGEAMRIESARGGLVVALRSVEDVRAAHIDSRMLHSYTMLMNSKPQVYVWADEDENTVEGRMFYGPRGGVLEVPATGAGVANMGWWYLKQGRTNVRKTVRQGAAVGRNSIVELYADPETGVRIGGRVHQVARGVVTL